MVLSPTSQDPFALIASILVDHTEGKLLITADTKLVNPKYESM
jgi:hypothetical protein